MHGCSNTRELVQTVTEFFQRISGCDAVGIRLREGLDYPYFETRGYAREFVEAENSLCARDPQGCALQDANGQPVLECLCGKVIEGGAEHLTEFGSFWTSDSSALVASLSAQEKQKSRIRGRCLAYGYQSIAMIPIGSKKRRLGLLQLNSKKKGHFNEERIALWERMATPLSIALEKFQAEGALWEAHYHLEAKVHRRTKELENANAALQDQKEILRKSEHSLKEAQRVGQIGSWELNLIDGKLIWSDEIFRIFGIAPEAFGASYQIFLNAVHAADRQRVSEAHENAVHAKMPYSIEYRLLTPDGRVKHAHERGETHYDAQGLPLRSIGTVQDITKTKLADEALQRAHQTLFVLKECDEALARAGGEKELLSRICRIIVEVGQAKTAWVGFARHDEQKNVRVAAWEGAGKRGYSKKRFTWEDIPGVTGPVGIAISTGKVSVFRNPPKESSEVESPFDYVSGIGIPLFWDGECRGALGVASMHADAFNEQEIEFYKQLGADLTFGLEALRSRAERERLQKELLKISEREKQLISQELHDGLCQNLAGAALMGGFLYSKLARRDDPDAAHAKQICDLLNVGVDEARNLSHGLHPVGPEGEGLMNALSKLADTVCNLFHIRCFFRCPEPVIFEDEVASTHLFRIAQEAINNARKHGEADRVLISLRHTPEGISLTIRDNGVGLPLKPRKKSGMGLSIMNHRASVIGAKLQLRRAGKKGTVVSCTLPVH